MIWIAREGLHSFCIPVALVSLRLKRNKQPATSNRLASVRQQQIGPVARRLNKLTSDSSSSSGSQCALAQVTLIGSCSARALAHSRVEKEGSKG